MNFSRPWRQAFARIGLDGGGAAGHRPGDQPGAASSSTALQGPPPSGFMEVCTTAGLKLVDLSVWLTDRDSPPTPDHAGIDNVFDRLYSEHLNLSGSADFGYPAEAVRINEPGRNVWVKLNLVY